MISAPEEIVNFWFADAADDPVKAKGRTEFWFGTSAETDAAIRERFSGTVEAAGRGELVEWRAQPRSNLALTVILDQFPRNIWRGRAEAFAYDSQALEAAVHGVNAGHLPQLSPIERAFLIMPFQHTESVEDQRESVRLYEELVRSAPSEWRPLLEEYSSFSQEHLATIERFGRFPHRNRVLGRISTLEELAFLQGGGPSYGQAT
jgi:uncharacterized protein (DUF924 family)